MIFSLVESSINWNRPVKFLIENILEIKHQKKKMLKAKIIYIQLISPVSISKNKIE